MIQRLYCVFIVTMIDHVMAVVDLHDTHGIISGTTSLPSGAMDEKRMRAHTQYCPWLRSLLLISAVALIVLIA